MTYKERASLGESPAYFQPLPRGTFPFILPTCKSFLLNEIVLNQFRVFFNLLLLDNRICCNNGFNRLEEGKKSARISFSLQLQSGFNNYVLSFVWTGFLGGRTPAGTLNFELLYWVIKPISSYPVVVLNLQQCRRVKILNYWRVQVLIFDNNKLFTCTGILTMKGFLLIIFFN